MIDSIRNFAQQFVFSPVVENADQLAKRDKFVVAGMGGSHLSAGLFRAYNPHLDIYIHRDYGLPTFSESFLREALLVASSYSGNTEEVLDFADHAISKGLSLCVVAGGGKLLEMARSKSLPYVELPNTGIQPRSALGFSTLALAKLFGQDAAVAELAALSGTLAPTSFEQEGKGLAVTLTNKVPLIYSSGTNLSIAYNWKIKFNETAKIPAFYNVFSELNHNEMTGFDVVPSTKALSERFHAIFLTDEADHPKIQKRMEITKKMYEDRGLPVTTVPLVGMGWKKIFENLVIADWTALALVEQYGVEAEQVPMVEEFKKLIAE